MRKNKSGHQKSFLHREQRFPQALAFPPSGFSSRFSVVISLRKGGLFSAQAVSHGPGPKVARWRNLACGGCFGFAWPCRWGGPRRRASDGLCICKSELRRHYTWAGRQLRKTVGKRVRGGAERWVGFFFFLPKGEAFIVWRPPGSGFVAFEADGVSYQLFY